MPFLLSIILPYKQFFRIREIVHNTDYPYQVSAGSLNVLAMSLA